MADIASLDRHSAPERVAPALEARLVEAMLECFSRWGVAKTTADDIARTAGVSRATLYRVFPGGMEVAFEALVRHETARFFERVTPHLEAADTLEDLLVIGAIEAADFLLGHEALGYILQHEPERVLPGLAFHRLDRALELATAFVAPHLGRYVADARHCEEAAELVVRLLLSYAIDPSPALDLSDPASVRRFVRTFILPALIQPADTAPKEP